MHAIVRHTGLILGSLLLVVVLAAAGVYVGSERHVTRTYAIPAESLAIPTDSASIARGRHLARAIAKCVDCHAEDFGGSVKVDVPAMGRWVPTNLTRGKGGVGGALRDGDWVGAIRHGVGPDGRALLLMPTSVYQQLSAADLGAIIAYAKSVPPVDRELPATSLGPVARALIAAGKLPVYEAELVDQSRPMPAAAPAAGPTAEYGAYLVHTAGCADCHGPTLAGGHIPQGDPSWPPAANLTPTGLKAYDEAAFFTALRTGVRPSGAKINEAMPWAWTREMTDDEIRAVWRYLQTVPPRELGAR